MPSRHAILVDASWRRRSTGRRPGSCGEPVAAVEACDPAVSAERQVGPPLRLGHDQRTLATRVSVQKVPVKAAVVIRARSFRRARRRQSAPAPATVPWRRPPSPAVARSGPRARPGSARRAPSGPRVGALERDVVGLHRDREAAAGQALFEQGRVRHVPVHAAHQQARLDRGEGGGAAQLVVSDEEMSRPSRSSLRRVPASTTRNISCASRPPHSNSFCPSSAAPICRCRQTPRRAKVAQPQKNEESSNRSRW